MIGVAHIDNLLQGIILIYIYKDYIFTLIIFKCLLEMLLGGETPVDSYNSPSNGNVPANENENSSITLNGSNDLIQPASQIPSQAQQVNDDYNKISPKDNNQNFLPENNLDLYQSQQHQSQTHISPRVQPYDLNIAHQQAHNHHLRSSNHHMAQYNSNNNNNNNNGGNGRKIPSPYKNLNMINHQNSINNNNNSSNSIIYDGIVSSSSGNEMMVLKEEPENGY